MSDCFFGDRGDHFDSISVEEDVQRNCSFFKIKNVEFFSRLRYFSFFGDGIFSFFSDIHRTGVCDARRPPTHGKWAAVLS